MRIDFYVSPSEQPAARLLLAYRLARKAWLAAMPCWISCSDSKQQQDMDEMLWNTRPELFMPHNCASANPLAPIVVALEPVPVQNGSVVINLRQQIVQPTDAVARIIELVCQEPQQLETSRLNFIQYRKLGFQPQRVEL